MTKGWRPVGRVRGALHVVNEALSRTSERAFFLHVSERTLYLLHNIAALDITFLARYATDLQAGLFKPLDDDDPEYPSVADAIENFQLEVLPVSLQELAGTNEGPELAQLICCDETVVNDEVTSPVEPDVGEPPEGFPTWDDWRNAVCLEAQVYVEQLLAGLDRLNAAVSAGSIITIALLALVLAPLSAGASLATFALLVLVQLLPALLGMFNAGLYTSLREELVNLKLDIVCTILASTGVEQARTEILQIIEAGTANGLVKEVLYLLFTRGGISNVYDMKIADLPGFTPELAFCDDCVEIPAGVHYAEGFVSFTVISGTPGHMSFTDSADLLGPPDGQTAKLTMNNNTQDHRWEIAVDMGQSFTYPGTDGRIVFTGRNTGTNPINDSIARRESQVFVSGDGILWQIVNTFGNPIVRVGPDIVTCQFMWELVEGTHFPFRYVRWRAIDRTVPGSPPPNGTTAHFDAVAYYENELDAPEDC